MRNIYMNISFRFDQPRRKWEADVMTVYGFLKGASSIYGKEFYAGHPRASIVGCKIVDRRIRGKRSPNY